MRYTVVWLSSAQNRLASLWTNADASDRPAITSAANRIDQQLAHDPASAGESRSQGRRLLFVLPLAVVFKVYEPDRKVVVLSVRRV
jgi:hypothetical protein